MMMVISREAGCWQHYSIATATIPCPEIAVMVTRFWNFPVRLDSAKFTYMERNRVSFPDWDSNGPGGLLLGRAWLRAVVSLVERVCELRMHMRMQEDRIKSREEHEGHRTRIECLRGTLSLGYGHVGREVQRRSWRPWLWLLLMGGIYVHIFN